jgi:hypothetical protein
VALVAYSKFRFLWGAVDLTTDDEAPAYATAETQNNVSNDVNVRRCSLVWDRSAYGMDRCQTHVDVVNMTAGAIDDTWTAGDFTTVEAQLDTLWGAIKSMYHSGYVLVEYRWYRLGPGARAPEPTVRVTSRNVPGTSGTSPLPQQCSVTVSLRTALRKHWGRMYFPAPSGAQAGVSGLMPSIYVDQYANAFNAYVVALAAADFYPVVYSKLRQRAYAVNRTVVDNVIDIQRRRRPEKATYQKVYGA